MDYRDSDGYFHDDVLRVLGRSSALSQGSAEDTADHAHPPSYKALDGGNFSDNEPLFGDEAWDTSDVKSSTSASASSSSNSDMFDLDAEWAEAKQVLYTTLVGVLLPVVCRYIGRRATFSVWTRVLESYFGKA
ncbi:hypothetical protein GGI15_002937 [Coemansia interrupta]|uniref:Uncharacterized protein n=1 Tax=Coemansia interrupta TaxID=1126814 RepID=A0A9W8LK70_9FUNG|nr:hypothetical protein GGI15_002937 [Coemansia interrupta]